MRRRAPRTGRPAQRGAALLLVIATMAVVLPAAAGLARMVTDAKLARSVRSDERRAELLLAGADDVVRAWLRTSARALVLPPEAPLPAVLVADDRLVLDGAETTVSVVAWDECGLVPLALARTASPLRLALPGAVTAALDALKPGRDARLPGLDWFSNRADEHSPFPSVPVTERRDGRIVPRFPAGTARCVGAWVATHGDPKLNVSTAPRVLLDAALRQLGRGGLELILAARARSEAAPLPPAPKGAARDEASALSLVTTSDCFAIRVEVRAGGVQRGEWSVWRAAEPEWRCVQRLIIDA